MAQIKLYKTRQTISIAYLLFNIGGVIIVYILPDSLLYEYINNGQLYIVIILHIIHLSSMITYYIASWSNPGYVPFLSSSTNINAFSFNNTNVTYCDSCKFIPPLQSKHCSQCNRCIIKFDHHCGWISNCVGYKNHKIYLLYVTTQFIIALFAFHLSLSTLFRNNKANGNTTNMHVESLSIWNIFEYTPLYLFWYGYKSLYWIIYQILFGNTMHEQDKYNFSFFNIIRFILFFGMLIAVIFSSILGLWNLYLIVTNQTTYSIHIKNKNQNDEKECKNKFTKFSVLNCWNAFIINIKSYCCGKIDDKYTKPTAYQPISS